MPQVNSIVLTDGTTPSTFTPMVIKPGAESVFADRSAGSKYLESSMTVSSRDGGNNSTVVRLKISLPIIVVNSDTGMEEVIETNMVDLKIRHADVATEAQRDYLVELLRSALQDSQAVLAPVVRGTENLY